MGKLRIASIFILLFLVVMVDFTTRFMSMVADGVLVAVIIAIALPILKKKKD